MDDVATFINSYRDTDVSRIRFDWNGKHSDEFEDRNSAFREAVLSVVLADISSAPLELLRDLFLAETQCSAESWGIVDGVGRLAENLLRRGGTDYLDDYLVGTFQSFDAMMGSVFTHDLPLAQSLLSEVRKRLASSPTSPMVPLWKNGETLFTDWVQDCQ